MGHPKPKHWVIQDDLFVENRRNDLADVLDRFGIPHTRVTVNGYQIDPEVEASGLIVTNGSIRLSKIANQRGWVPGSGFNENFSYRVWFEKLHQYLLNDDAVFGVLADRPSIDEFFIRPLSDEKTFTGRTMTLAVYDEWSKGFDPQTPILWASPKRTGQEHRHYIVDRRVITSSRYKLNQQPNFSSHVDPYIVDYAERIANQWSPGRMFVLDTFVVEDRIGVVELGCLTHAGLYQADLQKLVMAIEQMKF